MEPFGVSIYNIQHTHNTALHIFFKNSILGKLDIHFNHRCRANLGRPGWKPCLLTVSDVSFLNCFQTLLTRSVMECLSLSSYSCKRTKTTHTKQQKFLDTSFSFFKIPASGQVVASAELAVERLRLSEVLSKPRKCDERKISVSVVDTPFGISGTIGENHT